MVETNEEILRRQVEATSAGVPVRKQRFKQEDGVEQKVTLVSQLTGTFKNCWFEKGVENTLSGNVADLLLNSYPGQFKVTKLNGHPYTADANSMEDKIRNDIINQLKEEFDLVKKEKKPSARSEHSEPVNDKNTNSYSKNTK